MIKTVRLSDNVKVFLNICTSPEVKEYELQHVKGGANVSLPHSVSPEREDIDKGDDLKTLLIGYSRKNCTPC